MNYIRGTRDLPLILSANASGVLKWWIDTSYEVHTKMWGYTCGELYMGRGYPIVTSTKQNLNNHSSTESDIGGVHECMSDVFWTRYFMEAQE